MTTDLATSLQQANQRGLRLACLLERPAAVKGGWRCSFAPASDNKAPWFNGEGKTAEEAAARALKAAAPKPRPKYLDDIL